MTEFFKLKFSFLETVPDGLKKLSGVVGNEDVKNTQFNTLQTKVNNLEKEIPDATTLIHKKEYNGDGDEMEMLIKWRC